MTVRRFSKRALDWFAPGVALLFFSLFLPGCAGHFPGVTTPKSSTAGEPESLPPLDKSNNGRWIGERFVLLEKGAAYRDIGYELYPCPELDSCKGRFDNAKWTSGRRAKCARYALHRLIVLSVTPRAAEWLFVFRDERTGDTLYAATRNGVYHEIVRESDLFRARNRFKGRTIYSAHGFITTNKNGSTGTMAVRLQEPLLVTEVEFGIGPAPTKPIRLVVETSRKERGFIPVYYSWTNVRKELRRDENPWHEDIFESDPSKTYPADSATWAAINNHTIHEGMSRDLVRLSWGSPQRIGSKPWQGALRECWEYAFHRVLFDNTGVVAIEQSSQELR
jgi:hypothetical protein